MSLTFFRQAAERAAQAAAAAMLSLIGGDLVNVVQFDWLGALEVGAGAGVVSLLLSIAASRVGDEQDPSFLPPALNDKKPSRTPD